MSKFLSSLEYVPSHRAGYHVLTEALSYQSALLGAAILIPAGFETNFVTGRKLLIVRRIVQDKMNRAAVVHDQLYETGAVPRDLADDIFHEAMLVDGVARWRAWAAWAAVRACGWQFYKPQDEKKAA